MHYQVEGNMDPRMTLKSFTFDLNSSIFHFTARGIVKDNILTLYAGLPGEENKMEISLKEPLHLAASMFELPRLKGLQSGESRTFQVFDPAVMGERPVRVSALTDETVVLHGKSLRARKLSLDFMGSEQFAWIGEDGAVLREKGILGMTLEKATKEEALSGLEKPDGVDLMEIASIPANRILPDPDNVMELKVKLDNVAKLPFHLDGGRQMLRDGVVTIRKERVPSSFRREQIGRDSPSLRPEPTIQCDHPLIIKKVKEIISAGDGDVEKARKIVNWIYNNVKKRPVLSVPNALETLTNLVGDCNEHAVLLAAMARAAGIPAEVEAGLVYLRGRFYYHAWNALYLGGWVTADAVLGQMPADVTHIRFIRGAAERQMDLLGLIGRLRLEILGFS